MSMFAKKNDKMTDRRLRVRDSRESVIEEFLVEKEINFFEIIC